MDNIKQLYQLNVELEGLLRVLEQRDSQEARDLLARKFAAYSDAINSLLNGAPADQTIAAATAATQDILTDANAVEVKDQEAVGAEVEPEDEAAEQAIAREQQKDAAEPAKPIKLDEMLSARQSADLSKAFTLNDKYRFRRELFGGNDADFSNTINLIVSMNSYEEARDYLLHDLCWDQNNETVEDFLTIIKRHFQA